MAAIAALLSARITELGSELLERLVTEIPELRGDDAVQELLAASARQNVATGLDVLAHGIDVAPLEPPAAAAEYARRLAQRGVPIEALLRAYRIGHSTFLQWWLDEVSRTELTRRDVIAIIDAVRTGSFAYVDRMSEQLIGVYFGERDRWLQAASTARSALVHSLLAGETVELDRAETVLRYRLRRGHVGLVAWLEPHPAPEEGPRILDRLASALVAASSTPPLVVLVDERTLWAWLAGESSPPLEEAIGSAVRAVGPGVRAAVGLPASGVEGFRTTHQDALRAQTVALAAGPDGSTVTSIRDASLISFLTEDLAAARRWVQRVLGGLAADEDGAARLRQTLRVFLETSGSYTETAARLHVHKSTVHYRIRKAEESRGRSLDQDRIGVEVALLACETLGSRVLVDLPAGSD
jgi:DNA-binding PucR family transcriptional regulator